MTEISAQPAAAIYRGMDRAALDAAYNNGAAVADSPDWLARWQELSAAVRSGPRARLDIPYTPPSRAVRLLRLGRGQAAAVRVHSRWLLATQRQGHVRLSRRRAARLRDRSRRLYAGAAGAPH